MGRYATLLCATASLTALESRAYTQIVASNTAEPPEVAQRALADDVDTVATTNEIVVTARRRAESIQDVPQTVNVVTAAQVEKLNLRNFTEISSVVPGLSLQSSGAFSNIASVRGVTFDPAASGNNPSIEFYLNDAPIASSFLFQTTYDFGQFELQRGPQGTLRGRAAPSGSITVTTRRPDLGAVGVVFNGTVTDLHARKLDGALNIPIIADVLAVRVAGVVDENRGNLVRSLSEDVNPQFSRKPYSRSQSVRASIRFEPTDWAAFNVMAQDLHSVRHFYDQQVSESLINPAAPAATTAIIRPFERLGVDEQGAYNRQDQRVYVGNVDIRFAGQRASYVGSYSRQDFGQLASQDGGNFFAPPRITLAQRLPADLAGFRPVCQDELRRQSAILTNGSYDQCNQTIARRRSHELRLASEERLAGMFDYVVGIFYDRNNTPSNLTQETPVVTGAAALTSPVPVTVATVARTAVLRRGVSTEKSAFGNLTAHLLDNRLEVSGGLRYIDYRNNNSLFQSSASGTVPCAELTSIATRCVVQTDAQRQNATIYSASANYRITPDVMIYALTGSSWRPGPRAVGNFSAGPNRQGQTARELGFQNLPPERSKSYEVGVKTSFDDHRGRLNISAYHQTFRNYPFFGPQVFTLNTNAVTGAVSVSTFNNPGAFGFLSPVPVKVNGAEAEISYQLMRRWSVGLNASYADGRIKNGTIACTDLDGNGIPDIGATLPTVAQLQQAVGAGQALSQCAGVKRRSAVTPRFGANVQSEVGFDVAGRTDGFVRGLYSFFGKTDATLENVYDDVKAYGLLNLYAGLRDRTGAWELSIFGKNILREREIVSAAASPATTNLQVLASGTTFNPRQYRSISVTTPREFGLMARVALGSR